MSRLQVSVRPGRLLLILLFLLIPSLTRGTDVGSRTIPVLTVDDSIINPVVSEYIVDAIDRAEREGAPALVIELDTPGGLLSSTRIIVKRIMNSKVPVVVYVAPSGSRAGSAGVFITLAAHIAAMAPSTNIGAAHPVEFGENPKKEKDSLKELVEAFRKEKLEKGGKKTQKKKMPVEEPNPMSDKILNDTVAWVSTIAKTRGRNADWAVRAVKESISSREDEAVRMKVINFVAKDLSELLRQAKLDAFPTVRREMTLRQKTLNVLINPNIAYILMILGFYGLLFEITHPGVWFPGVAGLVCLILAFYAFHTLPTNYAGLALILLAIGLFIAEVKITSYGLLSLAGVVCLLLGSLFLVNSTAEFMQISLRLILPVVLSTTLIFTFLVSLAVKAQRRKSLAGVEGMIGTVGTMTVPVGPGVDFGRGKVALGGEIWDAVADQPIPAGSKVQVVSIEGMRVKVREVGG